MGKAHAAVGVFDRPEALVKAARSLKGTKLGRLEAYSPYPVHGIDPALGLRRSPLGAMVLVAGVLGVIAALAFQGWTSASDYPIVTGGKALFSWQAFVPVMFEAMVLFATLTAAAGMLFLLNRLPDFWSPMLDSKTIGEVTRDKFALSIENAGAAFDAEAARGALEKAGASSVEVVPELPPAPSVRIETLFWIAALGAVACAGAAGAAYWTIKLFPKLPPMSHMQDQTRLDAQEPSSFFKDGRGGRLPVPGTVARGEPLSSATTIADAKDLVNPLPRTPSVLAAGKEGYAVHCAICHGPLGEGTPSLSAEYKAKPANLQSAKFMAYTDGQLFGAMTAGKDAMPSYSAELTEAERWAVTHYVRALQRALHAREEDLR